MSRATVSNLNKSSNIFLNSNRIFVSNEPTSEAPTGGITAAVLQPYIAIPRQSF